MNNIIQVVDWISSATPADAWRICTRGDRLLWQWRHMLDSNVRAATMPQIYEAVDRIIARAIRRAMRSIRGNRSPWARAWRRWARGWLNQDRDIVVAQATALRLWAQEERGASACAAAAHAAAAVTVEAATAEAVTVAVLSRAGAAAGAASVRELQAQARDIHRELPEWPPVLPQEVRLRNALRALRSTMAMTTTMVAEVAEVAEVAAAAMERVAAVAVEAAAAALKEG